MSILDWDEFPLPKSWEKYERVILTVYAIMCLVFVTIFYGIATKATADLARLHMIDSMYDDLNRYLLDLGSYTPEGDPECYISCTYNNGTKLNMYEKFMALVEFNNWKRDKPTMYINYNSSELPESNESEPWLREVI